MITMVKSPKGWLGLTLALIAGAIYPLGFAPLEWWPIAIFSVATFWWLLNGQTKKYAMALGFSYGMGFFGVGVSWVYVSINTFGNAAPPLAVLLTILFIALLSLFFVLLGWFNARFISRYNLITQIIFFSTAWLILDIARGSGFVSFPWLYLGYSQTSGPLLGVGSYLGVHGVTFLLVAISCLVTLALTHASKKGRSNALMALVVLLVIGTSASLFEVKKETEQQKTLTVALIQPNIDQHKKWDRNYFTPIVKELFDQTENYWGADLIVWPEAAIPAFDTQVPGILYELDELAKSSGSQFITGIPMLETRDEYYAGIKMLGNEQGDYHKQQLVPFGEYVPLGSWIRGMIDFFDLPMSSFTPGSSKQTALKTAKADYIPAICYEIAFSGLMQQLATNTDKNQFKAIVTISNDTWFGESWGPIQHFQIAKMRAIETGLPVIRGTNNGITAIIDDKGRVINQIDRFQSNELAGAFLLENRNTWFRTYGYWSLLFIVIGLLGFGAIIRGRQ